MLDHVIVGRGHERATFDATEGTLAAPHLASLLDPEYWGLDGDLLPPAIEARSPLPTDPFEMISIISFASNELYGALPRIQDQRASGFSDGSQSLQAGEALPGSGLTCFQVESLLVANTNALLRAALLPGTPDIEPGPPTDITFKPDHRLIPYLLIEPDHTGFFALYQHSWQAVLPLPNDSRMAVISSPSVMRAVMGQHDFVGQLESFDYTRLFSPENLAELLLRANDGPEPAMYLAEGDFRNPISPPGLTAANLSNDTNHAVYERIVEATHFDM